MSVLAEVLNKHDYELQIESPSGNFVNQATCQKATIGENEIEPIELSVGNHNEKFAGRYKAGDLVLENVLLKSSVTGAKYFDDWYEASKIQALGYKRNARIIKEQAGEIVAQWELIGIFPKKQGEVSLDRTASESLMQTYTFSVDDCIRII